MKNKLESRLTAGRNINTLRYADDTILMAESKEELKSLLMKVKEKSEKAGLKLNTQKMKIMASIPIISWQKDGETMETMTDLIFLGSKITTDDDCSHEIKRHLLLGRKAMTNLDSVLKSRDITWQTKVHIMKAMAFPSSSVWIWELDDKESWAPKNWRFWTMVLEKTLKSPLDCKELKRSQVTQSCLTLCDPMDCTYQAPLSMGFSRQEYWSRLPFPFPGDLPDPGIEPGSPAL